MRLGVGACLLFISVFSITGCFTPSLRGRTATASLVFTPSSGAIGTVVTLTGMNFSALQSISVGTIPSVIISSSKTSAKILVMPGSTYNRITTITSSGTTTSSDFFTVTSTGIPLAQQGSKLEANDNIANSRQGYSVALSADGNTAIVGAYNDNAGDGAAWIYVRSGAVWTQQGLKLEASDNTAGSQQGYSVAISADGNTALVGGGADNGGIGAAWVYARSGTTWSQQALKLNASDNTAGSQQGCSVSISGDGNSALIGGHGDNVGTGAAWIWVP